MWRQKPVQTGAGKASNDNGYGGSRDNAELPRTETVKASDCSAWKGTGNQYFAETAKRNTYSSVGWPSTVNLKETAQSRFRTDNGWRTKRSSLRSPESVAEGSTGQIGCLAPPEGNLS